MLVSVTVIMTLQCAVIYGCCSDRGLVFLFLLPFDLLMEESYFSELVVVMFHTVYFYVSYSVILFYGFT